MNLEREVHQQGLYIVQQNGISPRAHVRMQCAQAVPALIPQERIGLVGVAVQIVGEAPLLLPDEGDGGAEYADSSGDAGS
jgi:hypothetical protein